jgi:hypothetical protein
MDKLAVAGLQSISQQVGVEAGVVLLMLFEYLEFDQMLGGHVGCGAVSACDMMPVGPMESWCDPHIPP